MPLLFHLPGLEPFYTLVPSLELAAALKIATTLWNRSDIIAMVNEDFDNWLHITELKWIVNGLQIPQHIKNILYEVIMHINEEVSKWRDFHLHRFNELVDCKVLLHGVYLKTFPFGTLDWTRTVQALVRDPNVPSDLRCMLACNYCLESDILDLWNNHPEVFIERRNRNLMRGYFNFVEASVWLQELPFYCKYDPEGLVVMWNYVVEKKAALQDLLQREAPECIVSFLEDMCIKNNITTLQYLLPYVTEDVKNIFLEHVIDDEDLKPDCYFYVLSLMNETQQENFMKKIYWKADVLCQCLCWSWRGLFMPIANVLTPIPSEDEFLYILVRIACKGNDSVCAQLLTEFWQSSCYWYRQYAIEKCAFDSKLIEILYEKRCKNGIKMIWNCCTAENKKNIIARCKREAQKRPFCDNELYEFLEKLT